MSVERYIIIVLIIIIFMQKWRIRKLKQAYEKETSMLKIQRNVAMSHYDFD